MSEVREGGCQCGAIRYRIEGEPVAVTVCHCKECQRQSGSAFGMTMMVKEEEFDLISGTLKEYARRADTGRTVVGAFCPDCGTRIYHDSEYAKGLLNLKPGTLDDTSTLAPSVHVWLRSKQPWVPIPDGVPGLEHQPV